MKHYMDILGKNVRDCVTGAEGIATSVCFDLYGCVQVAITPKVRDGKREDGTWFDHKRLIASGSPVMEVPTFESVAGPESKSTPDRNPLS